MLSEGDQLDGLQLIYSLVQIDAILGLNAYFVTWSIFSCALGCFGTNVNGTFVQMQQRNQINTHTERERTS